MPLASQNLLGYSLNALSESLVGRLGAGALSSSTLGNSTYSVMGLSIVWGAAAGMETLCGQVWCVCGGGRCCGLAALCRRLRWW